VTTERPNFFAVKFAMLALDTKDAFSIWKQFVCSPHQWIVKHNSGPIDSVATPLPRISGHELDLSAVDEI
jgi:hypothetical protein